MEEIREDHLNNMGLQIDNEARQYLNDSSKWAKFISITVFIFCGILLLFAIVGSSVVKEMLNKMTTGSMSFLGEFSFGILITIIVFAIIIMSFVYYFLFNYAVKIKSTLLSEDIGTFNKGLSSLKTFFIITTVLSILTLLNSIYNLFNQ